MNLVVLANLKRVDLAVRECGCEGKKWLKGVKFHRNRSMRKQVTVLYVVNLQFEIEIWFEAKHWTRCLVRVLSKNWNWIIIRSELMVKYAIGVKFKWRGQYFFNRCFNRCLACITTVACFSISWQAISLS